jgi:hypothetical protein
MNGLLKTLNDPLTSLTVDHGYGLLRNGNLLYVWSPGGERDWEQSYQESQLP